MRRRAVTLSRLKEDACVELRGIAREQRQPPPSPRGSGGRAGVGGGLLPSWPSPNDLRALAEKAAPRDEESLVSLARHTPQLAREPGGVREAVVAAIVRSLELELRAIEKHGESYLEEMDRSPG